MKVDAIDQTTEQKIRTAKRFGGKKNSYFYLESTIFCNIILPIRKFVVILLNQNLL